MKAKHLFYGLMVFVLTCGIASAADKVIEWKFDGDLTDSSENGLDGIAYGSPAYGEGVSGQALVSDGDDCAYLTGIDTAVLPVLGTDTWSINVWVYPTEIPQDWRLLWCLGQKPAGGSNSRSVYSSGYATGSGKITFVGESAGTQTYTVSYIPWDINQWQMITTTYDGTIVRLYKNGILIAMREQTFLDAPGEIRIPSNPWAGNNFFIGRFDEFTVWRGKLTHEEILGLILPGVLPELEFNQQVVYYTMGDPASTVMPDHSGLSNDGQLYGYTEPLSNWIAEGFRGDALLFDGAQRINQSVTVSQPANYTVSFWFKSGEQIYTSAFYTEKQVSDPGSGYARGTQLVIRANNSQLQVFSKERDYNMLFNISADGTAYLDGVTWHHLAVVADGEAAQARLYIDGELLTSGPYLRSSHKTTTLSAAVGYSWADGHFLGEWAPTYIDEVKLWNGALTPGQIQALAAYSNFGNDLKVDLNDAAVIADDWLLDTETFPGATWIADDMEGSIDGWSVYGTGTISQTANAYAGSGALRWDYLLPATAPTDPNNYTNIVLDLGETKDLSDYDQVSLWLYRHTGNTPEDVLYLKFYDDMPDPNRPPKAEQWADGGVTDPNDQWAQWIIDPNSLLGPRGVGIADESDLEAIRYILIGTGSSDRNDARSGTIDIDEFIFVDDPVCSGIPEADLNRDCRVDLGDLLYLVEEWLLGID